MQTRYRYVCVLALLLLCGAAAATAPVDGDAGYRPGESDAEPVDPAEFRPQTMPPSRPPELLRGGPTWVELGPAPTRSAQVGVPPDNLVSGAVQAIAPHPTNPAILYIGAANGGIWRTNNASAPTPIWTPQTDNLRSQSIGALAFDPTDPSFNTLIAGIGRFSNFARRGDDEIGVYYTTNGGTTWATLGSTTLLGQRLIAVSARGAVLMAASTSVDGGLFRSVDTGATWTLASGTGGLPTGGILDLVGDPGSSTRFYIAIRGTTPRVLRSVDGGASWTDVTAGITGLSASTTGLRFAIGPSGVVFAAVVNNSVLAGVFRSPDQGGIWTAMDVPAVHPGGQGTLNTSIAADPGDSNIVYIAGDRITVSPFTGNVQRGNATLAAGSQFTSIVDGNALNTTPHADSRAMVFDAAGTLLQADDGGIYRRVNPTSNTSAWSSVIGNLNVMEVHDLAHDRVSDIVIIGTQDNGTHIQSTPTSLVWTFLSGGDGGDVAVDDVSLGTTQSYRYSSAQNWGTPRRRRFTLANVTDQVTALPTLPAGEPQFVTPLEVNAAVSTRLLIGGLNTLFEINNAGAVAPTLTTIGPPGANRNAMAYGAAGAPDVAYVGRGAAVFKRGSTGFAATATLPAGAATITDVALNPANPDHVYAVDDNQVFRSTDGGTTWQDVTGNLTTVSGLDFRTIEFVPQGAQNLIAVGTRSGVFTAEALGSTWAALGNGIPDVLVFDLRYIASQNRLIAGTLGRGVWSVQLGAVDDVFANGFEP